ncbi:MAG: nuclear transport factor 2 family protein [marine benthic group bacterium]|nr:nuclear transport factor 2 family protein [Gemmatimonadota bacterium]
MRHLDGVVRRTLRAAALAMVCIPAPLTAQDTDLSRSQRQIEDRTEVLATVRALFRALGERDVVRLEEHFLPQALTTAVRFEAGAEYPSVQSLPEVLESIAAVTVPMTERIWDPEVRVDGEVASLWAPYDFYVDGSFSHCGHDAVHLVRVDGRWRVLSMTYTIAEPPACRLHPDGPPLGRGISP